MVYLLMIFAYTYILYIILRVIGVSLCFIAVTNKNSPFSLIAKLEIDKISLEDSGNYTCFGEKYDSSNESQTLYFAVAGGWLKTDIASQVHIVGKKYTLLTPISTRKPLKQLPAYYY